MNPVAFGLVPHPGLPAPADVRLSGRVHRDGCLLHLTWRLEAPPGTVALPAPDPQPGRRHGLWETTCFEAFLGHPESGGYHELNLSPSGHWNLYRFGGYRDGMQDEEGLEALPAAIRTDPGGCEAGVVLDLAPLGLAAGALRLGVTAVVARSDGGIGYWALAHPGDAPDFHLAEAFRIRLDA